MVILTGNLTNLKRHKRKHLSTDQVTSLGSEAEKRIEQSLPLSGSEKHGKDFLLLCPGSKMSRVWAHPDRKKKCLMVALLLMTYSSIRK